MTQFMQWYAIGAVLFTIFVIYRSYKHKIEHDYLSILVVFILWPVLLVAYFTNVVRKSLDDEEDEAIEESTDQA